ncbi:SET domain-containing protein [Hyalangium minutum]|uniref:Proteins containing SET domain protein n=1 Tax=Hyalangium minutum TaxID=394096 RepID=A0A085WFS4_9BACT|nr:SET domain-containing protein [Hyalangium minutum]KFE66537.1 Proteins containing SET domain protein [Hyalangium minutum]
MSRKSYLPHTWADERVSVKPSPIDGKGLFATRDIPEGTVLMVWGGQVVDRKTIDYSQYRAETVVAISEAEYLALPRSDTREALDVYLNHSCDPTAWLIDEVTIVARRPIQAGEEITTEFATWFDYEPEVSYSENWACKCGSPLCRKALSAQDWRRADLQEKYAGHFSPFLERRIHEERQKV